MLARTNNAFLKPASRKNERGRKGSEVSTLGKFRVLEIAGLAEQDLLKALFNY